MTLAELVERAADAWRDFVEQVVRVVVAYWPWWVALYVAAVVAAFALGAAS